MSDTANKLLDIRNDIRDAVELLRQASTRAYRVSGEEPGQDRTEFETITCSTCDGTGHFLADGGHLACDLCGGNDFRIERHSDPGEPPKDGWPLFVTLSGTLEALALDAERAMGGEVGKAFAEAQREMDEAPEPIAPGDEHMYRGDRS